MKAVFLTTAANSAICKIFCPLFIWEAPYIAQCVQIVPHVHIVHCKALPWNWTNPSPQFFDEPIIMHLQTVLENQTVRLRISHDFWADVFYRNLNLTQLLTKMPLIENSLYSNSNDFFLSRRFGTCKQIMYHLWKISWSNPNQNNSKTIRDKASQPREGE